MNRVKILLMLPEKRLVILIVEANVIAYVCDMLMSLDVETEMKAMLC